jgi:hypothetical protein
MELEYKYTAIIIEPRKIKALYFVLNNILDCLSNDWKIIFFHGINNEEYSQNIVNQLNNIYKNRISLVKLDVINLNQKTYSELLANRLDIYNYIDTEYFLIFQTDSMMFKRYSHLMDNFLNENYDYIGSPWLICCYSPTEDRDFIGNGGFSLRKKDKMVQIIKNNKWDENNEWYEDLFFTKKYDGIEVKKPPYEIATSFCVDEVFSNITMACHRPWCHQHFNEFIKIYPECEELKNLQFEEE